MAEIEFVGTSHIARQSIKEIGEKIESFKPAIIAVELDPKRLHALLHEKRTRFNLYDIRRIGLKGYAFALIGSYIQQKLGRMVGTAPGSDMLEGIKLARKHKIPLALIDRDIEVTLRRFSQALSWRERGRFVIDIIKGLVTPSRELERYGVKNIDLSKVPQAQLIRKMIAQLKRRYPNVYRVLIEERNVYMHDALHKLAESNPDARILAVVGAGHKEDLEQALKTKNKV